MLPEARLTPDQNGYHPLFGLWRQPERPKATSLEDRKVALQFVWGDVGFLRVPLLTFVAEQELFYFQRDVVELLGGGQVKYLMDAEDMEPDVESVYQALCDFLGDA